MTALGPPMPTSSHRIVRAILIGVVVVAVGALGFIVVRARSVGQNQLADSGLDTSSPQNRRRAAETPEVDKYDLQISGFGWLNWVLTHAPRRLLSNGVSAALTVELAGPASGLI